MQALKESPGAFRRLATVGVVTALVCAHVTTSETATAQTTYDKQIWTAAFLQARVTGREPTATSGLSLWLDVHARRTDAGLVAIVRPALGYRFTKKASVWAGIAEVSTFSDAQDSWTHERRAWQQGLFTLPAGPFTIQLRPRLEERLREGQSDVALRARAFARVNVSFGEKVPVNLATWVEPFFHLNDVAWGPVRGFDQNRLFLGAGIKGPAATRLEVGYLNVTVLRPTDLLIAHNIALNMFADF